MWNLWRAIKARAGRGASERRKKLEQFEDELSHALKEKSDDWLKELYKAHTDRFKKENDRIWETGKILLPLSLGAFGGYAALNDPKASQILALALASSGLVYVWHLIATSHRHFQDIHQAWLNAIEKALGIYVGPPKDRLSLNWVRRFLLVGVVFIWLALLWQSMCEGCPWVCLGRMGRNQWAIFGWDILKCN